jgi:hypothetical protein
MNFSAAFKSLCLPSKVYFVLSFIGILSTILAPSFFGDVSVFVQLIHFIYVVFWAWVLNLICKAGYKWLSWVLVLAPFLLFFFIAAFILNDAFNQVHQGNVAGSTPVIVLSK